MTRSFSAVRSAAGVAASALCAAVMITASTVPALGAATVSAPEDRPTVALAGQTAWVAPGGEWSVSVRLGGALPPRSHLEIIVTVFPAVATRSDFAVTFGGRVAGNPIAGPTPYAVESRADVTETGITGGAGGAGHTRVAGAGPDGTLLVRLPIQDPAQPRDPNRVLMPPRDGVHPVRVELRDDDENEILDRFVTHLVYLPEARTGAKLAVSMAFPVHAPLGVRADGSRHAGDARSLHDVTRALELVTGVPVALVPTPEMVATLSSVPDEPAVTTLGTLRRAAGHSRVISGPYVPVNVPALLRSGLQREIAEQADRGKSTLDTNLRVDSDARTWVATEPLDEPSLTLLRTRGTQRVVAVETGLAPVPDQKVTLTRPFLLRAGQDRVPAIAADAGLAAHFDDRGNPVLLANRLLADLAVLYLDRPGSDRRAVVVMPPRGWTPNRDFLGTMLQGLSQNPIVEPVSLDEVFASVSPARDGGRPLVRRTVPAPTSGSALDDVAGDIRSARRRLESLGGVVGSDSPLRAVLEERLLASQSVELRTTRQRNAYLTGIERAVSSRLRSIQMPEGRSITLTARRGEIPVTFQNRTGAPARVVIKVESEKLEFPAGTTRTLELVRRNTTERFPVLARTSGAFPLRITLESPDGQLVIGRARLTVRSTAASGVSLVVSLGAALFLAMWWGRHALKGRRARRLVPA